MHNQWNQVVESWLKRRVVAGKCGRDDAININYLSDPGVHNDSNLESTRYDF
jgi:hypothetical protein